MGLLLVIGNGFDLDLNAKTSYNHFYNSNYYEKTKTTLAEQTARLKRKGNTSFVPFNQDPGTDYIPGCWDQLFYLESIDGEKLGEENTNWCDVEQVIHDSFTNTSSNLFSWETVFQQLHRYYHQGLVEGVLRDLNEKYSHKNSIMTKRCLREDWEQYCENRSSFYKHLLAELNKFEKHFGKYIITQTRDEQDLLYIKKANYLADTLAGNNNYYLDSFNYSTFLYESFYGRHINGDYNNPIFGIEASSHELKNNPDLRIFTKTSRRLYQDSYGVSIRLEEDQSVLNKAVIFGHSLNKMDYDYFTYLFTRLGFNTYDTEKMGKVEFVFDIYDKTRDIELRDKNAEAVYSLVNYYEDYTREKSQHVLLNLLRFSEKLIIKEISVEKIMQDFSKKP